MVQLNGYMGKILRVDLSSMGKLRKKNSGMSFGKICWRDRDRSRISL